VKNHSVRIDMNAKSSRTEVQQHLERLAEAAERGTRGREEIAALDGRTRALIVIGAAICTDAPTKVFQKLVASALREGATPEQILGTLLAVAPEAGGPRIVSAAPKLSLALGYDVDAAFEHE
jgi:alkylhydroperoxidase/carboxymuconolactone decarboxylase family protein YurZ